MKALVVGNATVDETYAVAALPRAGESLIGEPRGRDAGGKGANVATLLARCGVATRLVAVVGDDERGAFLRTRLEAEPLDADLVVSTAQPTDLSLVCVDADGVNTIVTTVAATRALPQDHALAALDGCAAGDLLVLHGNLSAALTLAIIDAARVRALEIVLNPSPLAPWARDALGRVDTVFVNAEEAMTLVGEHGETAVRALLAAGSRRAVLTLGAGGAIGAWRVGDEGRRRGPNERHRDDAVSDESRDGAIGEASAQSFAPDTTTTGGRGATMTIVSVPAAAVDVVDTTGAGDTFLAVALASAARRGVALDHRALEHAARAAAITVGAHGALAAFPSAERLAALLGEV